MVTNQRALWTFLIYALVGPFFAALALVIVIALASVFGSRACPSSVVIGQAGLAAFVWSTVPAAADGADPRRRRLAHRRLQLARRRRRRRHRLCHRGDAATTRARPRPAVSRLPRRCRRHPGAPGAHPGRHHRRLSTAQPNLAPERFPDFDAEREISHALGDRDVLCLLAVPASAAMRRISAC